VALLAETVRYGFVMVAEPEHVNYRALMETPPPEPVALRVKTRFCPIRKTADDTYVIDWYAGVVR
jgi:hypothetical protein